MTPTTGIGRLRQEAVYRAGVSGARPAVPTDWGRLEAAAERAVNRRAFAYVAGGAGRERTMDSNRDGFDALQIVPRVLRDVSERDLSTRLFGRTIPAPLLLAPVGVAEMAHRSADVGAARAAAAEGIPMAFSNQASRSMEECAAQMGGAPRWFQLYWSTIDELVESFLGRAERCGCEAVVVTLDTTLLGLAQPRPRPRVAALQPGSGDRAVHQRPRLPAARRRARQCFARTAGTAASTPARRDGPDPDRPDSCAPRVVLGQPALPRAPRGRGALPGELLPPDDHVGRPGVAAGADPAAHRPQGSPAPR
jgi:hypothetical protein